MFFVLFLTATLMALGTITFKRFEERTSPVRGIIKLLVLLTTTALITSFFGERWGIAWAVGAFALGIVFHFWWTLKNKINPFTAEPRARYYELRGWQN